MHLVERVMCNDSETKQTRSILSQNGGTERETDDLETNDSILPALYYFLWDRRLLAR